MDSTKLDEEKDDDIFVKKDKEYFCFETIMLKQEWNLFMCRKRKVNKEGNSKKIIKIKNLINFYEQLSLKDCHINIFALKKFIKNNIKSLRSIEIINCFFYLSDDAVISENEIQQVNNERMFQELKFDWLIEQFKFKNIQTIIIKLSKDPDKNNLPQQKLQTNQHEQKKEEVEKNKQKEEEEKKKKQKQDQKRKNKEELCIELFNCEKNSKFIQYDTRQLKKIIQEYTDDNLDEFVQEMIWGDMQDPLKIKEKLYEETILAIEENLRIYNKYTKYALNDNKLIIIEDVLYNGQSLKQLYNLIQLKCQKIQGIIFKDNGKIPPKVFSSLMKQFFLIPKLKQICFLSSVLHEDSLYELQYLIQKKNIQYLILFRSYFLKAEIDKLLNIQNSKVSTINHQRFVIIDISQKKSYEFTPYSNFNDLKQKENEDMLEVERLNIQQQDYPKQIYNQIIFFQGKNLSIVNKNASEKILFKHWDFLKYRKEIQRQRFEEKQDNLIQILEEQFREDDINILNYSLVKTLIKNVIDKAARTEFNKKLEKSKSFQFLKERFPIQVAELISFKKESHLQTCYSYLYGFTTIKEISFYYIYNNNILYQDIRENNKKSLLEIQGYEISLIIKEIFTSKLKDDEIKQEISQLKQFVGFSKILDLNIQENRDPDKSFFFLNEIFKECENLKKLSLSSNMLNDNKLNGVDFSNISEKLEEFDINNNTNINNMSFLDKLFKKANKLKKLGLQKVQLTSEKIKTINFSLLPPTLEELDISYNTITDITFLNTIFNNIPNLKKIDMTVCSLNTSLIKEVKFAPGLKEIIINDNENLNLADLIVNIGFTDGMQLEYFSAYEIGKKEPIMDSNYMKYYGQLQAFSELKKLYFWDNYFSDEQYINLILSNHKFGLTALIMKDAGLNQNHFQNLQLENVYQSLEILDLSEGFGFESFEFLQIIFEKATKLKILNLGWSNITEEKIDKNFMQNIPESLEEFYFSKNELCEGFQSLLNTILKRCQSLKVLHLECCDLNDEYLNDIDWTQISTKLIDLNIANNPRIQTYYFLNDIFKKAESLQKINLQNNKAGEALYQINFDLLSRTIQQLIIDEDEFFNQEFQDDLFNSFERYMNLCTFQQRYQNIQNDPNLNYFGVFKYQNLSTYRNQKEQEEEQKQLRKKNNIQNQKIRNKEENIKNAKHTHHINPLYFYSFFSKLELLIPQRDQQDLSKTKIQCSEAIFQEIVEYQNVYSNYDYQLLQFIDMKEIQKISKEKNEQSNRVSIDYDFSLTYLKELNLANKIYPNLQFLQFFLENGSHLTKIDMSNMDVKFDKIEHITNKELYALIDVNFSGNKCTNTNIFDLLDSILIKAPNLQKLNLSNMNMNEKHFYNFDSVSETLQELNISENKNIPTLSILNRLFSNCEELLVLNISKIGLKNKKLEKTNFWYVTTLQEFNCSDNDELDTVDFINIIMKCCQNIVKINLSNCNIHHNNDNTHINELQFKYLSTTLKEIDLSNNQIVCELSFMNVILKKCKLLEKIDLSGQIAFGFHQTQNEEFVENQLQEFNFSGNIHYSKYDFIPQFISKSDKFHKLTIQQVNLSQRRFEYFRFKDIGKQIHELDISKNDDLEDIQSINFLKDSSNFSVFIAQKTSLNNTLMKQINIPEVFKNLRVLDLSGCHYFITFDFLNEVFQSAVNLQILNLSGMQINQKQIDSVNFQKIPSNLEEFDLSQNKFIESFTFLNNIFKATNASLICLNLSECGLDGEKLQEINFSLLSQKIEQINIQNNEKLDKINFLNGLLDRHDVKLKILKISQAFQDIIPFLHKYLDKIEKVDCNFLSIDFEFFSQKQFMANINILKFIKYFFNDQQIVQTNYRKFMRQIKNIKSVTQAHPKSSSEIFKKLQISDQFFGGLVRVALLYILNHIILIKILQIQIYLQKLYYQQSKQLFYIMSSFIYSLQKLNQNIDEQTPHQFQACKDSKSFLMIQFLKYMMEKKSQRKSLKTIQHFFYLLFNDIKIESYFYQSEIFILSPYFLFQQPQDICCYDEQKKKEEKYNIKDSYNLSFFALNLLKKLKKRQTNYIFGYDKFFFSQFPDFYVQNLEGDGSDLQFIIDLKSKMDQYKVSKAFLPIRLNLAKDILKSKKLNEYQALQLINSVPPAVIKLKGVSIQLVKSWYAINFYAPLSVQTYVDVDYSLLENSSIANFLTIRSYHMYVKNFTGNTFLSKLKQKIGKYLYQFFRLLSSQPQKFDFDHTVIHLENVVQKYLDNGKYNYLRALFPFYIFFCIFGVYFFSFSLEITCGNGISWYSYITYAVFGLITFFIEAFIFSTCLKYVSHLVPELKPNCLQNFPYPLINGVKLFILEINWINQWYINYFVSFVLSQLSRFDYFTNFAFLYTSYQCGDQLVFTLALISMSFTTFISIVFFILNFRECDSQLITGKLDKLYEICNLLEFQAVADVLDIISPSNCVIIFGKMFNQRIVNCFIRILLQDIPYLIIQVLYLLRKGVFNQTVIFSLISSSLMFLISLKNFLTITPSRLGQEDFNQINTIKKKKILPNYLQKLSQYESQIVKLNQYELLKCIRSLKYFQKRLQSLIDKKIITKQQMDQQLLMVKQLRNFYPNQEFMSDIFGKLEYNDDNISIPQSKVEDYFQIQEDIFNKKEKNITKNDQNQLNEKGIVQIESGAKKQSQVVNFVKKITGQKDEQTPKRITTKVVPLQVKSYNDDNTPNNKDNQGSKVSLLTEEQDDVKQELKYSQFKDDKSKNEDNQINELKNDNQEKMESYEICNLFDEKKIEYFKNQLKKQQEEEEEQKKNLHNDIDNYLDSDNIQGIQKIFNLDDQ